MSRRVRKQPGQALLEFALIIPFLILMITLFIDIGRAIFTYSQLANSVREGTRFAIVHPYETVAEIDAIDATVRHYSPTLNPDELTIVITPPSVDSDVITIKATYIFRPITPGLGILLGEANAINLEAQSTALMAPLYQD